MTRQCTWVECKKEAKHEQKGRGGKVWAYLCEEHNNELEAALAAEDVKKLLSSWVKASGGAKKMAETM